MKQWGLHASIYKNNDKDIHMRILVFSLKIDEIIGKRKYFQYI